MSASSSSRSRSRPASATGWPSLAMASASMAANAVIARRRRVAGAWGPGGVADGWLAGAVRVGVGGRAADSSDDQDAEECRRATRE